MDIRDRFVGWLWGAAYGILRRFRFGRRWLRKRGLYPRRSRERVVASRGEVRNFSPAGFLAPLDPTTDRALPVLQRRAAYAIFERYGVEWVPGEYLTLLETNPDPITAFRAFCEDFSLPVSELQRERAGATGRLQQCVGILLELAELRELAAARREHLVAHLRRGEYDRAEELLDIARTVYTLVRESEALLGKIVFPHYRAFLAELRESLANPFELSKRDAADARTLVRDFLRWQDQFDGLIERLDSQLGWMVTNWPGNAWGRESETVKRGLIRAKEDLEAELKSSADTDIATVLGRLEEIYGDLLGFIEEIKTHHGGGEWKRPADDRPSLRFEEWCRSARVLGFSEASSPTEVEIKAAFRKLAFHHHPDRHSYDPEAERAFHNQEFKKVTEAYRIMSNGKPEERRS